MKAFDIRIRTYEFSKNVVLFINKSEFNKFHYPIISQLIRSATSIGANVIEAKSGNSRKNLISFFSIALRSANETRYWLSLVKDTMIIDKVGIEDLLMEVIELSNILGKSIITLKKHEG
jgi:four helix bundle protein